MAEEARAKNAREREEIQEGFRSVGTVSATSDMVLPAFGLTQAQVCRTAVLVVNSNPLNLPTREWAVGDLVHIAYTRTDGKSWEYKCRLEGSRVHWAPANGAWFRRIVMHVERRDQTLSVQITDPLGYTVKAVPLMDIP